jgi:hypothetical protein
MVEDLFSYEVSIAEDTRSDLTNKKLWGEVGISEESRPTKHTLGVEVHPLPHSIHLHVFFG